MELDKDLLERYAPEDLVALTAELSERFSGFDSTSITYERAQHFMEAVCYCLQMYEQSGSSLPRKDSLTAREAYRLGYEMVCHKARQVGELYQQLLPSFQSYGSLCLQDTVMQGIPAFLMHYDARYSPQDMLLTLDYPVLSDLRHLRGVQAIWEYLRCITLEQRFLNNLDVDFIYDSLRAYHTGYELLIENLCSIVLTGAVRQLLQQPTGKRYLAKSENQSAAIEPQQLELLVRRAIGHLAGQDREVEQYLLQAADELTVRVALAMNSGA